MRIHQRYEVLFISVGVSSAHLLVSVVGVMASRIAFPFLF